MVPFHLHVFLEGGGGVLNANKVDQHPGADSIPTVCGF